ncbi:MAG: transglutaminaseTgpA domain-containing protein [Nitriliruptoraceae bacterium]
MRRDLALAVILALVALATLPAYDRVFADNLWRQTALLAAAGAIVVALLARWARVPALLSLPLSALLLLAGLPRLLGVGAGWGDGVGAQWQALLELADAGAVAIAEEVAPVTVVPGLLLLLVVGWWLIVALAAELLLRARALGPALLLLVTLWAVPLAVPSPAEASLTHVVPWLVAAGALALAHVQASAPGPAVLPVSGLVLLGVAVAAGTAAPWVLPGYQAEALASFGSGGTPRGYQPIVDVSTRLRAPEEREVLQVRASQPTYLRLAGLDTFDGSTWRLGPEGAGTFRPDPTRLFPADGPLPPEEPALSTRPIEADIEVLALENLYVPLPYQPTEVLGPIRDELVWSTEGGFLAAYDSGDLLREPRVGLTPGAAYRVLAEQPAPTIEALREVAGDPAVPEAATALPRPYPELGELAREVYAEAGAETTIDQVLALQDWFIGPEGGFTYDLDVPALRGEDALTRFVLEDRVGYCEYFATAMAVMLRETGIPARVAVGFLPGERVAADPEAALETYVVSTSDAHAWVEVLFPGYGWVTFEPTPRSDGAQLVPRADELLPVRSEAERAAESTTPDPDQPLAEEVPPDAEETAPEVPEQQDASEDPATSASGARSTPGPAPVLAVLLLLGAVAALFAWGQRQRRRQAATLTSDPQAAVLSAQRELFRTARRLGRGRGAAETTAEVLRRWEGEQQVPPGTSAVAGMVQEAAFSADIGPERAAAAVLTLEQARTHLAASVSTSDALWARARALRGAAAARWEELARWWRGR